MVQVPAPLLPMAAVGDSWAALSVDAMESVTGLSVDATYALGALSSEQLHLLRFEVGDYLFKLQGVSNIYLSIGGIDELFWAIAGSPTNHTLNPENIAARVRSIARALGSFGHKVFHGGYNSVDSLGASAGIPTLFAPYTSSDFGKGFYEYVDMENVVVEYRPADPIHLKTASYLARIQTITWARERDFE